VAGLETILREPGRLTDWKLIVMLTRETLGMSVTTINQQSCVRFQVKRSELADPGEYDDILDDVRCEIEEKYGVIRDIIIPRPVCHPFPSSIVASWGRRLWYTVVEGFVVCHSRLTR
jgi:hypothetical protein